MFLSILEETMKFNPIQSVLFIILLTFTFCKKDAEAKEKKADKYKTTENSKSYFITAVGGLRLREEPSSKSKAMTVIPEGSVITVEGDSNVQENIGTVKGTWLKTTWVNDTGFVHSGFLCDVQDAKCNEVEAFIQEIREVCKPTCSSTKDFVGGDDGIAGTVRAYFTFDESQNSISWGRIYGTAGNIHRITGKVTFAKKIKGKYYINLDRVETFPIKIESNSSVYLYDPIDFRDGRDSAPLYEYKP